MRCCFRRRITYVTLQGPLGHDVKKRSRIIEFKQTLRLRDTSALLPKPPVRLPMLEPSVVRKLQEQTISDSVWPCTVWHTVDRTSQLYCNRGSITLTFFVLFEI